MTSMRSEGRASNGKLLSWLFALTDVCIGETFGRERNDETNVCLCLREREREMQNSVSSQNRKPSRLDFRVVC